MTGSLALAVISLVATFAYLAIFVALHTLPTGFNPIRNAVSDYALGRYGYLFRIALWVSSIGVLALAGALAAGVGTPPLAKRDLLYLVLIPAARIGMTAFPTDVEGKHLTRTGAVHYLLAIAAFTLTYLVISETTSLLRELTTAHWLDTSLKWSAWAVTPELALVVITMFRPLRKVFGLFERLFLVTTNVWFILVALLLVQRGR
jgi:Protein of unknown function (DUF998)